MTDPFDGACPVRWMIDDVGRYLAGPDATAADAGGAGRRALTRAAGEVDELLRSAFAAHEVVATELRFAGPSRGFRRTVFALSPTPVALMLLCTRLCDPGDDVTVIQHTAARGSSSRTAPWPFGLALAEELTRPPAGDVPVPVGLEDLGERGA
ncbi:MAG TPA: hypothetical protein VFM27_00060 [Acidimicrobiales bacterium]|nr:hypothetical protein [Acidimicrobiales bacterium]